MTFAKDFDSSLDGLANNMIEASDDRRNAQETSNDRDSMSEFEFAMSAMESENAHGEHMLSADELFFKGKLLPLYVPHYIDGSEQKISKWDVNDQVDQLSARKRCSQQVRSNKSTPTWALYGVEAETPAVKSMDLIVPTSPKAPKCSIKLRELFGFRKMAKSRCSCADSGEVNTASPPPCKPSRSSSRKQKAGINQQKTSLMLQANAPSTPCTTRHCSCESSGGNKTVRARNSASQPLLACRVEGCETQLRYSVISFKDHQQYENLKKMDANKSPLCSGANDKGAADHRVNSLCIHKLQELRELRTGFSEHARRSSASSQRRSYIEEYTICRKMAGDKSKGLRMRPMRAEVGETSVERSLCSALMNDAGSGGRGVQATAASGSGFKSAGTSRAAKSLERSSSSSSSSYSPKSLQRKYDQLKAIRQREGWRVLERSSSYNSSMHSMKVSPVLNVPSIVCISRSKSSNYAGMDSGLGHPLFSAKNNLASKLK